MVGAVREEEAEEEEERQKRGDNGKVLWGTRKTVQKNTRKSCSESFYNVEETQRQTHMAAAVCY